MATDTNAALIQTAIPAPEPHLLGLDSEGWVYVSLTLFFLIALFYAKAHRTIVAKLDERIADTRRSLDEARSLRAEAEALLAEAQTRQAAAHRDAEGILKHAKVEADQLVEKARGEADLLIVRRGKMATDKIAAAERAAIADVRARAAAAAVTAATTILVQRQDIVADAELINRTIANLN